jgi:hypothetical protein
MPKPLLRVRLIAPTEQADTIAAAFLDTARQLIGPTATYRTRKLPARTRDHHRVYLTVTPPEPERTP